MEKEKMNSTDRASKSEPETVSRKRQKRPGRLAAYHHNVVITALHPDGMTSVNIRNDADLVNALVALYSDGHGDFGQLANPAPGKESEKPLAEARAASEIESAGNRDRDGDRLGRFADPDRADEPSYHDDCMKEWAQWRDGQDGSKTPEKNDPER
ncbi:MAG: hypothetical protein ABIN91_19135 [Mucilaginibacter sp.]|uniref:hypothetical protein n=1 Tax=Mucilaginibacter sp. TaxID=1882438 RepID=UPI0032638427